MKETCLIAAVYKGEYKVASFFSEYGEPMAHGTDIHGYLQDFDADTLIERLEKSRFLTNDEIAFMVRQLGCRFNSDQLFPQFNSDTLGGNIFYLIQHCADHGLLLRNDLCMARSSEGCHWGYVLDLDNHLLEVYRGWNKEKLGEKERFRDLPVHPQSIYQQIRLKCTFNISAMPSLQVFYNKCYEGES